MADWIYRYAAGVDATPLDAGFHTVVLHPLFDSKLGSIRFDYASSYGEIHSAWQVHDAIADWQLTLPSNTKGWLELNRQTAARYRLEGVQLPESGLAKAAMHNGINGFELQAGSYRLQVDLQ